MECTWKMAFEQRTEVTGLRLRQVPPVIAEEYRKDRYLQRRYEVAGFSSLQEEGNQALSYICAANVRRNNLRSRL